MAGAHERGKSMTLDIEKTNEWTVLHLDGPLNAHSAGAIQGLLLETLKDGSLSFLLDLEKVTALDSSGLAALVRFYKEIKTRGGTLALCAVQREAMTVFRVTRLDKIFTILPDPSHARAA
jgi:anti-sigma B factor antagonist